MILLLWLSAAVAVFAWGAFMVLWGVLRMVLVLVWAFLKALVVSAAILLYAAVELARSRASRPRRT